jgi:O-antigen ligase/energy-converting hydrogenase Eha subunit E
MELTSAQYLQLIAGLVFVIIAFVAAYIGPERVVVTVLMLLLPFQPITSVFGTVNTGLALIVFTAFLLGGRIRRFPLLFVVGAIMLAYMVSFTQVPRATYPDHIYYLVAICANFALFYIVYNHVCRSGDIRGFFNMLLWMNILVGIYCLAQLVIGMDARVHLGVGDLALRENRWDTRLSGPFGAVGITAEYLVIQILLLLHMYMHETGRAKKYLVAGVMLANLAFLVATGNRGGFLVLVGGGLLYLVWFRRELGSGRLLASAAFGGIMLAIVSVVIVTYTDFNVLYDRLLSTEVKEGVPDSRVKIWPLTWERVLEAPVSGHGPRFRLIGDELGLVPWYKIIPYPHSLYLFILSTIGVVGLLAWAAFFFALFRRFVRAKLNPHTDPFIARVPKLSILILVVLLIDQIKVSMFRFNLSDYQQIVFVLIGGLLAAAWIAMHPDQSKST